MAARSAVLLVAGQAPGRGGLVPRRDLVQPADGVDAMQRGAVDAGVEAFVAHRVRPALAYGRAPGP